MEPRCGLGHEVLTVTELNQARYWGDLTGFPLDSHDAARAPALEIDYFVQMGVYH